MIDIQESPKAKKTKVVHYWPRKWQMIDEKSLCGADLSNVTDRLENVTCIYCKRWLGLRKKF